MGPWAVAALLLLLRAPRCSCRSRYSAGADELQFSLKKSSVVPDVIGEVPRLAARVTYPGGAVVRLGNVLKPERTAVEPKVAFSTKPGLCYTVILLDPDAPSPQAPTMRHWLHWLVVNVAHGDVSTVAKYAGPTPPEGRHRYVFLVYEQDEPFSRALVQGLPKQRAKFNLTHFVMLAGLKELVAVNFFYAEHPE